MTEVLKSLESASIDKVLSAPRGSWMMTAIREQERAVELSICGDLATALLLSLTDDVLDKELGSEKEALFVNVLTTVRMAEQRLARSV